MGIIEKKVETTIIGCILGLLVLSVIRVMISVSVLFPFALVTA